MTQKAKNPARRTAQESYDGPWPRITKDGNKTIIERENGTKSIVTEPEATGQYPFPCDTYWHVVFGAKARKHDPERIYINWSGDDKHFAREVECIARGEHLNVAYDARENRFSMVAEPGATEKQLSPVWTKPFRVLTNKGKNGQATEQEYRAMLEKGTSIYKQAAQSQARAV